MNSCGRLIPVTLNHTVRNLKYLNTLKMGKDSYLTSCESKILKDCRKIIPPLSEGAYKGQAGRIGVIGGSLEYTGAPYFSAISALKVGCDLSHVFCPKEAAGVIKSYSPELIVHPILDDPNALELIKPWIPRLHVLVIGPGLGREPSIFSIVTKIIDFCRSEDPQYQKPLVIDADGLFMITKSPEIIQNYPHGAILTPNAIEFSRLAKSVLGESISLCSDQDYIVKEMASALGPNITVLRKGKADYIGDGNGNVLQCTSPGTGRRCGGQGDLLSGSLGTFYAWAIMACQRPEKLLVLEFPPNVVASYAACLLTRECNVRAFAKTGRSTVTTDMIEEIHPVFETLFQEL